MVQSDDHEMSDDKEMKVRVHTDIDQLMATAETMLKAEEPLSTMLLGVCHEIQDGRVQLPAEWLPAERFGLTVEDDGSTSDGAISDGAERCLLAALQTPPYGLVVHVRHDINDSTLDTLVQRVLDVWQQRGLEPSNVLGPKEVAEAIAMEWARRHGLVATPRLRMRLYELLKMIPPPSRAGHLRRAHQADEPLVREWFYCFNKEALGMDDAKAAETMARHRIAAGEIYLWQEDTAVSMAARSRATESSVSVGHVYTPPGARGQGLAACCVAALSQSLLDEGFLRCTLFTDLNNPVSNRVYQRLGYRPLGDFNELVFVTDQVSGS